MKVFLRNKSYHFRYLLVNYTFGTADGKYLLDTRYVRYVERVSQLEPFWVNARNAYVFGTVNHASTFHLFKYIGNYYFKSKIYAGMNFK